MRQKRRVADITKGYAKEIAQREQLEGSIRATKAKLRVVEADKKQADKSRAAFLERYRESVERHNELRNLQTRYEGRAAKMGPVLSQTTVMRQRVEMLLGPNQKGAIVSSPDQKKLRRKVAAKDRSNDSWREKNRLLILKMDTETDAAIDEARAPGPRGGGESGETRARGTRVRRRLARES